MKPITTMEAFNKEINTGKVIALFTADWCPDCRIIEPVLPEIEQEFPDFTFISVDRDDLIQICQEYDIFGIPSFIAFGNGREIDRFVSKDRKSKDEIMSFIRNIS